MDSTSSSPFSFCPRGKHNGFPIFHHIPLLSETNAQWIPISSHSFSFREVNRMYISYSPPFPLFPRKYIGFLICISIPSLSEGKAQLSQNLLPHSLSFRGESTFDNPSSLPFIFCPNGKRNRFPHSHSVRGESIIHPHLHSFPLFPKGKRNVIPIFFSILSFQKKVK